MRTLKEERARALLSVRELALKAGVAPATVHEIETGQRIPHLSTVKRIASALDVEPANVVELNAAIQAVVRGKAAA
jgi:transcriptional regulator with XRE-family HTH domain